MDVEVYSSTSEEETFQLGVDFSSRLVAGDVVAFFGELGAGKTELIKGICHGLDVHEIVSSPTYTIINQYAAHDRADRPLEVYHIDLYRIESPVELDEIGLPEILNDPGSIKMIEWAEHATAVLPPVRYDVYMTAVDDENGRRIEIVHRDVDAASSTNGSATAHAHK